MKKSVVSLADMASGGKGVVASIDGGSGMLGRLQVLGLREGKEITKISAQWMGGPVVVRCGNAEVAVGFGMARRIHVVLSERRPS